MQPVLTIVSLLGPLRDHFSGVVVVVVMIMIMMMMAVGYVLPSLVTEVWVSLSRRAGARISGAILDGAACWSYSVWLDSTLPMTLHLFYGWSRAVVARQPLV